MGQLTLPDRAAPPPLVLSRSIPLSTRPISNVTTHSSCMISVSINLMTTSSFYVTALGKLGAKGTDGESDNFIFIQRFGDRAFAPRVWNSLPSDIKLHRSTTTSFKRRLKTVLFNQGFAEYM